MGECLPRRRNVPGRGEVWLVDLGMVEKARTPFCGIHPGGMKEGSRGSKRSETPGPAAACPRIPEGCQKAHAPGAAPGILAPAPGCRTLPAVNRGSPLRRDPRLPSGNPPGCAPDALQQAQNSGELSPAAIQSGGGAPNFIEEPAAQFGPDAHELNGSTLGYHKERLGPAIANFMGSLDVLDQIQAWPRGRTASMRQR